MLEYGITFRTLLAWVTGTLAVIALIGGWANHSENVARAGLVFLGLACTQWVLQDNAKTRRCVRAAMRSCEERPKVTQVP